MLLMFFLGCADASNGPVHRTACKSRHYLQIQRGAAVSLKDCLLETSCQYSHAAACSDLDPSQAQRDCCSEQARFGLGALRELLVCYQLTRSP
mmetsp:Transcript_4159/g.12730  ORF Transcript_4159/g.12730 Transcript_4159/m.12730 type:complete len:93 (-) Transcript_4159:514-792(-)